MRAPEWQNIPNEMGEGWRGGGSVTNNERGEDARKGEGGERGEDDMQNVYPGGKKWYHSYDSINMCNFAKN